MSVAQLGGRAQGARAPPIACREAQGPVSLRFFSAKFLKNVSHIFIMKWPKSEEKIGIGVRGGGGALEKLEGLPPAFLRFFLQNFTKKNFFSFMQNEVAEIRGEG